jgi:hypothetical protein
MQQSTDNSQLACTPVGRHEVISLNDDSLDVQELEHRLELAAAAPDSCWVVVVY